MDLVGISTLPALEGFDLKFDLSSDSNGSFESLEFGLPQNDVDVVPANSSPLSSLPESPQSNPMEESPLTLPLLPAQFSTTVVPPISIKIEQGEQTTTEDLQAPTQEQQNSVSPKKTRGQSRVATKQQSINDTAPTRRKRTRSVLEKEKVEQATTNDSSNNAAPSTPVVQTPINIAAPSTPSGPSLVAAGLPLTREELRKLSSKGFDQITSSLTATHALTEEEERQLKRQKRLIKNRESAQLSRQRKKQYMEELEKKVENLNATNESLAEQVSSLTSDKQKLEEEVLFLRNLVKQSPTMSPSEKKQALSSRNAKAAGICLLIMLFSFGLVSEKLNVSLKNKQSPSNDYIREEIPEVVPKNALSSSSKFATGRVLLEAAEDKDNNNLKDLIPDLKMPSVEQHQSLLNRRNRVKIASVEQQQHDQQEQSKSNTPVYIFCQNPEKIVAPVVSSQSDASKMITDVSFRFSFSFILFIL